MYLDVWMQAAALRRNPTSTRRTCRSAFPILVHAVRRLYEFMAKEARDLEANNEIIWSTSSGCLVKRGIEEEKKRGNSNNASRKKHSRLWKEINVLVCLVYKDFRCVSTPNGVAALPDMPATLKMFMEQYIQAQRYRREIYCTRCRLDAWNCCSSNYKFMIISNRTHRIDTAQGDTLHTPLYHMWQR